MNDHGELLIVDDDLGSLKLLTMILVEAGYSVRPANSGELALTSAITKPPEMILLDIRMPGMDGLEVCRQLQAQATTRAIPIIFLSVVTDVAERVAGLQLGAVDLITKPYQREELLARIHAHLDLSRLRARLEQQSADLQRAQVALRESNERLTEQVKERTRELNEELIEHKHAEEALRKSEAFLKQTQEITHVGGWEYDAATQKVSWTDEVYRIYEVSAEYDPSDIPQAVSFYAPEEQARIDQAFRRAAKSGEGYDLELKFVSAAGKQKWIRTTGQTEAVDGQVTRVFGMIMDVTERRQTEEQLRHSSTHDALTGTYNRAFFETELTRLEHSREFPVSLIIADIDNMKLTNDELGHAAGDELLKRTAQVLQSVFRVSDLLARIGGDEFALLLPKTDHATATQILARIQENQDKYNIDFPALPLKLSLGVATSTTGNLMDAYKLADSRMYADKRAHKLPAQRTNDD